MIDTPRGAVPLRDLVVSLALDGLTATAICNQLNDQQPGVVSFASVKQWLYLARRDGIAVPRGGHAPDVEINGKRIGKRAYAIRMAKLERLPPRKIAARLQALGALTQMQDVRNWLWAARRDGHPIIRFKGGRA